VVEEDVEPESDTNSFFTSFLMETSRKNKCYTERREKKGASGYLTHGKIYEP